jgi:hypothetical protein
MIRLFRTMAFALGSRDILPARAQTERARRSLS